MQQTVTKIGDSYGFVIPQEIQQRWNLNALSRLDMDSQGDALIIKMVSDSFPHPPLDEAINKADENYRETFRRLAE